MKKLEDKKKLLDNEKLEKLNMLKIKLSTIKGVDEEDLKNTEAALSQMEEKMKNYQKAIAAKVFFKWSPTLNNISHRMKNIKRNF